MSLNLSQSNSSFDIAALRAALLRHVAFATIATAVGLAALLLLVNQPNWWRGYLAASVASVFAAVLSLPPLLWGARRGYAGLIPGAMIAAGVRGAVCVGVAMLAVGAGHYPRTPTFLLILPYYFALLAVETMCLARLNLPATSITR